MRFGVPDPDDSDDGGYEVVDPLDISYSSDESDHVPDFTRTRRTKLGESIRDLLASSESEAEPGEPDSEDEVGDLLGGRYTVVVDKTSWREASHDKAPRKTRGEPSKPRAARRRSSVSKRPVPAWGRWEPTVSQLLREPPSEYIDWMKETEAQAWREGHRVAGERQQRLREIEQRVRAEMRSAQEGRKNKEADELNRMLEGLTLRYKREADDTAKRFEERRTKLWADVDAVIKEAERKKAEEQAAAAAEARKKKEEEEARIAAAEKEAIARKAEQERLAKEKAEKEAKEKAEKEKAEEEARAKAEADKAEADKKAAAAAEGNRSATEWAKWVQVQKRMKSEVIEVVKANREIRSGLRQALRLVTRSLGQVINTRETIVRVTNDIHSLLVAQLPKPPSVAEPTTFNGQIPPTYGYLLSHISKALIKQAESEVSAKSEAAFPLARIVLGLILRGHGALGPIFFARLVKKCPWVIPHYPIRAPNQPRDEYEKSTGRGSDESLADYIARMAGITTLYFAVLQTPIASLVPTLPAPPTPEQFKAVVIAPFGLPSAWTWLASILRAPLPGLEPSAHLIAVCLNIAGYALVQWAGPKQVGKLLGAVKAALDAGKIPGDSPAAQARLQLLLEGWVSSRTLKEPSGRMWEV